MATKSDSCNIELNELKTQTKSTISLEDEKSPLSYSEPHVFDKISRVLFPIAYTIYLVSYFVYYLGK